MSKSDARQPKGAKRMVRVHFMMDAVRLAVVDAKARKLGISRSNFIAQASYTAAKMAAAKVV